ncbi:helix-turn-helix domain-containing protein [Aliivibrio fischeri]|nr:helix-turn-helix domain-containing protein [Aliivibrio fischeri]
MMSRSNNIQLVTKDSVKIFSTIFKELDSKSHLLLREATIPIDIIDDDKRHYLYLPESCLKNLMEVLSRNVENHRLGVLFWRLCKDTYIPSFIERLTVGGDLKSTLNEFSNLLISDSTNAKVYLQEKGGTWWLVREKSGIDEPWFKFAEMFSVIFMCELLRNLTSHEWAPSRIGIRYDNDSDFLALPALKSVQFFTERPVTAIEIPKAFIYKKVNLIQKQRIHNISNNPLNIKNICFVEQFKMAISPYLPVGKLPIKLAAEILRMNVRTLQRKLKNEGSVYQVLIEEMCFELITRDIVETTKPITIIATQYGYSDAGHFSRAFKRIYGMSPTLYRKNNSLV